MNIEKCRAELIEDLRGVLQKTNNVPFDKAFPTMKRESWKLGDKYKTTGDEIMSFLFSNYQEITKRE